MLVRRKVSYNCEIYFNKQVTILNNEEHMSEDNVATLRKLGLSSVEAKTYLIVLKLQTSTPTLIAKGANIARTDVYRVLSKLEGLGLIERAIGKTNPIKATPLKKALKYLVDQKKRENIEAKQGIQNIIKDYMKYEKTPEVATDKPEFIFLPKNELYIRKISYEIDNSKKSIKFIFSLKKHAHIINEFENNLLRALKRNVKIKIVTETPSVDYYQSEILKKIEKHNSYVVTYRKNIRIGLLAIFDENRVIIDTSKEEDSKKGPALWSNNQNIIEIAQFYFDNRQIDQKTVTL
ncbi:MAG: hypothetical protein CW716_06395 [Candidatus Bathyarchaeum sp.]|nr:MAG: hypothetical protein CW716_06395 [Candidatus Bathyarchaeum sp.]